MSRGDKVLAGLGALQVDGTLCDIELKAEEQTIPAHKNVLTVSTPYFEAMFTGQFEEKNAHVVEVKGVSFVGLKNVVDYIYTAKIKINAKNIEDILPAAHLLQMEDMVKECKKWMSEKITKTNCFTFLRLAEKYNIETVETAIIEFVLKNFRAVSETKGFADISKEALCRYLSSDFLKTEMEEYTVYKAAKKWITKNKITDNAIVFDIMKNVRFALIPPITLSEQVTADDMIDDNKDCRKLVSEAMKYHVDVHNQPFYKENMNKPRGTTGILIIPNGQRKGNKYTASEIGNIDFLPFPAFEPTRLSKSLNAAIVYNSMCAMQINNFMFLFGAKSVDDCDGYQNFTLRYNASNDSWMKMDPIPRETMVGSAITCSENKKEIFLVGGLHVHPEMEFRIQADKITPGVYIYGIPNNSWTKSRNLPNRLVYSATTMLGNLVYVTGGYSSLEQNENSVYAFDTKGKIWLTKAKMKHKRCQHTLDAVNGKLYAIAGRLVDMDPNCVASVEAYDPLSDQWTEVVHSGTSFFAASSLVNGSNIYIIGGSNHLKKMSVYEVDKNRVNNLGELLPSHCRRNVSALLTLPKLL